MTNSNYVPVFSNYTEIFQVKEQHAAGVPFTEEQMSLFRRYDAAGLTPEGEVTDEQQLALGLGFWNTLFVLENYAALKAQAQ